MKQIEHMVDKKRAFRCQNTRFFKWQFQLVMAYQLLSKLGTHPPIFKIGQWTQNCYTVKVTTSLFVLHINLMLMLPNTNSKECPTKISFNESHIFTPKAKSHLIIIIYLKSPQNGNGLINSSHLSLRILTKHDHKIPVNELWFVQ